MQNFHLIFIFFVPFHPFLRSEDEEIVITSTSLNTEKLKREMIPWERAKEAQLEGNVLFEVLFLIQSDNMVDQ